ncbi:MAG: fatty acid desaturase [Thermoanaerobaculia bacterium]
MQDRERDWTNILFLILSPLVGIGGTFAYSARFGVAWWEPVLCLMLFVTIGLSIGTGYHRRFAHRTYECHSAVEAVLLFFGAMALQNSALRWSRDHRDHHRFVDTDRDPYSIKRGALWAHFLWIFYKEPPDSGFENVPDLLGNPRVMWQHRWYSAVGVGIGLGLPTLVGALFGSPLGGLLWGGFLRIVLVHHTTFFVNSVAHLWGARPYSTENSARDNWILAFFTHGEGYHNFHHKFPSDFRNGIRWYQWDPNKWCIQGFRLSGLARNLRITPPPVIERARLAVLAASVGDQLAAAPEAFGGDWSARLGRAQARVEEALQLWKEAYARQCELKAQRARGLRPASDVMSSVRRKVREYERRFRESRLEWLALLRSLGDARPIAS